MGFDVRFRIPSDLVQRISDYSSSDSQPNEKNREIKPTGSSHVDIHVAVSPQESLRAVFTRFFQSHLPHCYLQCRTREQQGPENGGDAVGKDLAAGTQQSQASQLSQHSQPSQPSQQVRFMVLGQVVYLSPDSTVEHAKLKSGSTIKVLPVKAVHEGSENKGEVGGNHGTNAVPAAAPAASAAATVVTPPAALPASAAAPAALPAAPPAAPTSTRIDYSKWDHLETSSDEEAEEEFQEEEDEDEVEEEEEDEEEVVEYRLGQDLKWKVVGKSGGGKVKAEAVASGSAIGHTGGLSSSSLTGDGCPGKLRPSAAGSSKEEETAVEKGSKKHEETAPKQPESSAAAANPGKGKAERGEGGEREETEGASKRPAQQGGIQLLDRTDMVHYLDVRNGWDVAACEPCFDRVVSRRTKLALGIHSLRDLRSTLRRQLKESVSLVLQANQASSPAQKAKARAIEDFSSKVPLPDGALGGRQGVQSSRERYKWKCERAPGVCAEAMVLEWMAEPRVGVLMDLGMIRSRLPTILGVAGPDAGSPALATAAPPVPVLAWSCCYRCSGCWAAYRRA
ncbi:unnamed protein product, partial [Closterium sp. NIES-53]